MRREDGVRPQRRGAQSSEDAALAIDRDDRDERQHGARRDEQGSKDREVDRDRARNVGRDLLSLRAEDPAEHDEDQDGDPDRSEDAERLPDEDLDLEPGQFPESSQHRVDGLWVSWTLSPE